MKILVADDETPIREWIVFSIEKCQDPSLEVVGTAKSGTEAYEMALVQKPDIIITDIRMPGMDGIELMKRLSKKLPYTDYIILTNHAEFSYAREAVVYGAKQYLLKSELRGAELITEIKKICNERMKLLAAKPSADCYAGGILDVYELFLQENREEAVADFFEKRGLKRNLPYYIFAVRHTNLTKQQKALEAAAAVLEPAYLCCALRQRVIYLLLQTPSIPLLEASKKRLENWLLEQQMGPVGIADRRSTLSSVMKAATEAENLLDAWFFRQKPLLFRHLFPDNQQWERQKIRSSYRTLLTEVSLRKFDHLEEQLDDWFAIFQQIPYQELSWSREMCLKMVLSFEERYDQMIPESHNKALVKVELDTAEACQKSCHVILDRFLDFQKESYSGIIEEAVSYIRENYQKELSLIEVAEQVHRSPEYFSRLFKEETGENFSVYLMMYRLNRAKELLEHTDMKVYQIAHEVGYTTPSYFSRIFKRYMGISPEMLRGSK